MDELLSGEVLPDEVAPSEAPAGAVPPHRPLSVAEICAGAGGQSLGLHLAGFRHRVAVELDPDAARTLELNLARLARDEGAEATPDVRVGDVASLDVWNPDDYSDGLSLLAGGVPCPPFSIAGKQRGASDERDLFAWAVELAGRMQADALLLENVRGLAGTRFRGYRQAVLDRLEEHGYQGDWELLQARDFGVPQLRPRFVLVALKQEFVPYFEWPEGKPTQETVGSTLKDMMPDWPEAGQWAENARGIAPTIVGGSKKHGGADLGPTRAKRAWLALGVDGHGIADGPPGADYDPREHPRGPKLTTQMVARLQGWHGPEYEDWEFTGRKTAVYRQIGNAFPPPVARAVGESIASALRKEKATERTTERTMHDEVYRILREKNRFLTVKDISTKLNGSVGPAMIQRRLAQLALDFNLEERVRAGVTSYQLGAFKAFRGQEDHERHLAFSTKTGRSRVS